MDHAIEGMREVDIDHPHAIIAASGARRFFEVLAKWPDELETDTAIEEGKVSLEDLLQLQLAAWQCVEAAKFVEIGLRRFPRSMRRARLREVLPCETNSIELNGAVRR